MSPMEKGGVTPALLTWPQIAVVTGVLALLSLLCWLAVPGFFVEMLTITVLFVVSMSILTPLAYRNARKHGEWPPKERG